MQAGHAGRHRSWEIERDAGMAWHGIRHSFLTRSPIATKERRLRKKTHNTLSIHNLRSAQYYRPHIRSTAGGTEKSNQPARPVLRGTHRHACTSRTAKYISEKTTSGVLWTPIEVPSSLRYNPQTTISINQKIPIHLVFPFDTNQEMTPRR